MASSNPFAPPPLGTNVPDAPTNPSGQGGQAPPDSQWASLTPPGTQYAAPPVTNQPQKQPARPLPGQAVPPQPQPPQPQPAQPQAAVELPVIPGPNVTKRHPMPPNPQPAKVADPTATTSLPDDLIITGEAVALDIRPAMLLNRIAAVAIDIAAAAIVMVLGGEAGLSLVSNQAQASVVIVVTLATGFVLLPTAVETLTRGRSLGKFATGLQIVRDDGAPIRFRQAFVRALVGAIEIWVTLGVLAVITSLINSRGKRLGDLLAGTYCARIRSTELALAPLLMPPELIGWSERADIRGIDDRLALQARLFLSRTGTLMPDARERVARQLAALMEPHVSPPPPWGTNPERFMAATLVARRDREYSHLAARASRERWLGEAVKALPYGISET